MKKKSTKYLDFYEKCMKTGVMPEYGLCHNFRWDQSLELFEPTPSDCLRYHVTTWYYWGSNGSGGDNAKKFNDVRQTIVLFLAAMNGEL